MYPVLFEFGPLKIHSFGACMALAFLIGNFILEREFKKRQLDVNIASNITLISIIFGIIGAKLFHILENIKYIFTDPINLIFSASGLTFYGGFILAIIANYIYLKGKKLNLLDILDSSGPAFLLAYAIGRVGCLLAGDGCYGIPTNSFLGMSFPNGIVSTLSSENLELLKKFKELYPNEPIPYDINVFPTPIFESIATVLGFIYLNVFFKTKRKGLVFSIAVGILSAQRFAIEFIRNNEVHFLGLTQAQIISLLFITAILIWYYND